MRGFAMPYKNILVALDYGNEASFILKKAVVLSKQNDARLHVIHVVEPVDLTSPYDLAPVLPLELEQQMVERAKMFLSKLLDESHLSKVETLIAVGSVKSEIFSTAEKLNIDLIVLGTHGRHGVGLLLGSTATSILHGTPCDVLAVKINS